MSFPNDQALRRLLESYGVSSNAVDQGIEQAVGQTGLQQEMQQTYQSAQAAAPPINVPVRQVEPPITLRGTMTFTATFHYESLVGLPLEEVKNRIYRVMSGENDNGTWLPLLRFGDMDVWREVVRVEQPEPIAVRTADPAAGTFPGRVSEPGPGYDRENAGYPEHRDAADDAAGEATEY